MIDAKLNKTVDIDSDVSRHVEPHSDATQKITLQ